ncbi:MAG: BatD family protein [Planctomycetota bacterium]
MSRPLRFLCAALLLALASTTLHAQRVLTQLSPDHAFLGQPIHYFVQARDTEKAQHEPPQVDGLTFQLQSADVTDRSTQMMIVNGRSSTKTTANYTFDYLVVPSRTGRFRIPAAEVVVEGETWNGDAQTLIVEDAAHDERSALDLRAEPTTLVLGQEGRIVVDVYLRHLPTSAKVKDPLELYDRGSGFSLFDQGTPPPVLDLPWIDTPPQGLGPIDRMEWLRARVVRQGFQINGVNGRFLDNAQIADVDRKVEGGGTARYRRYRFALPIRGEAAGSYSFAPVTLQGKLVAEDGSRLVWRDAFTRSAPLTVVVLEPPTEGRPASFSGAVGDFGLEMPPPTPTQVHVGDAIYATLIVSGQGFLKGVDLDLASQLGSAFRVERVGLTDSLAPGATRPPGFPDRPGQWRQWDFKLYPLKAELKAIPEIEFAWFDPTRREYRTARTAAVPITVVPAGAAANDVVVARGAEGTRKDIELVATSALSANVTDLNLLVDQSPRPLPYLLVLVVLPVIWFALAWFVGRRRRLREDPLLLRRMRAASRFTARLREAKSRGGKQALLDAHAALRGLAADLTGGDEEAMTADELARWLARQDFDAALAAQVKRLGEAVEAVSYGGGSADDLALTDGLERVAQVARRGGAALLLVFALLACGARAQDTAAFTHAQTAFEARDFTAAAQGFAAMLGDHYENGYVLYDLGNAWLRAGELGRAIAAYRRASLFIPTDANLEVNLRRALDARKHPLSPPDHRGVLDYLMFWRGQLSFRAEMGLAVALGLLAFMVAALRLWSGRRQPALKILTLALAALCVAFLASAMLDHARISARDRAVIVVDGTALRTGPGETFEPRYEQPLGEGSELRIEERRDGWLRVLAGGQYEGWIPDSAAATW